MSFAAALGVLGVVLCALSLARGPVDPPPADGMPAETTAEKPGGEPNGAAVASSGKLDRRWLPDHAAILVSIRPSIVPPAAIARLIEPVEEPWRQSFGPVIQACGVKLDRIERMTLVVDDLRDWPNHCLVVLELVEGQNAEPLARSGRATELSVAGRECRRLPGDWPHPVAVVSPRLIVTAPDPILRRLDSRPEPKLTSEPFARVIGGLRPAAEVVVAIDLAAARAAQWPLPTGVLDVWPAGRESWRLLWETAEAAGVAVSRGEPLQAELAIACAGDSATEKALQACASLVPATKESVGKLLADVPERLKAGELNVASAQAYETALKIAASALNAAQWEIAERLVWLRTQSSAAAAVLGEAAVDSRGAARGDWFEAATLGDQANHERILTGLLGYQKAEGNFPPGAIGGALLPPETRLSWIATMLPYLGHADLHRRLETGYAWNAPQNRPTAKLPVPEMFNPALGPSSTAAGFPVTHYVGVAGVGEDAGRLGPEHPRAGVFGYGRSARLSDITDGAANTIAIMGVQDKLGPWAAGGSPSVRALTQRPYVNGPDGFGSGLPNGMLVGMADGSVRFLSKDTDSELIERMATIRGGEPVAAGTITRKPGRRAEAATATVEPPKVPVDPPQGEKPPVDAATARGPSPEEIQRRLAMPLLSLQLGDTPLSRAVETLSQLACVPIALDAEALWEFGITPTEPAKLDAREMTVRQALDALATARGLACVIDNGCVLITAPTEYRQTFKSRRYSVSDLIDSRPEALADLGVLVQRMVAPDTWQANGGRGTLTATDGALVISQTEGVHRRILLFCEKLRVARGKPTKSKLDPDLFVLTTRAKAAEAVLSRTITVNFQKPAPLRQVLDFIAESAQAEIIIDWSALLPAGVTTETKAAVAAEQQPVGKVLEDLLAPLSATVRPLDAENLQITSRKAAAARLDVEFYPIADLLKGRKGEGIVDAIKKTVAPASWSDAGGAAAIHFDAPGKCLIILQSAGNQAACEATLAQLRD